MDGERILTILVNLVMPSTMPFCDMQQVQRRPSSIPACGTHAMPLKGGPLLPVRKRSQVGDDELEVVVC